MSCDKLTLVIKVQYSHQQLNRTLYAVVPFELFTCEDLRGSSDTVEGTPGCELEKLCSSLCSANNSLCHLLQVNSPSLCVRLPICERKLHYKMSTLPSNVDNA